MLEMEHEEVVLYMIYGIAEDGRKVAQSLIAERPVPAPPIREVEKACEDDIGRMFGLPDVTDVVVIATQYDDDDSWIIGGDAIPKDLWDGPIITDEYVILPDDPLLEKIFGQ